MYGMLQSVNTLPSVLRINCIIPNNIFALRCTFYVLFNLQRLALINVLNASDSRMPGFNKAEQKRSHFFSLFALKKWLFPACVLSNWDLKECCSKHAQLVSRQS